MPPDQPTPPDRAGQRGVEYFELRCRTGGDAEDPGGLGRVAAAVREDAVDVLPLTRASVGVEVGAGSGFTGMGGIGRAGGPARSPRERGQHIVATSAGFVR